MVRTRCCDLCEEYREAPNGGGQYYACVNINCSCHTTPTVEPRPETIPPGFVKEGDTWVPETVEPTDCCGKCEPGDSGLHTKCLLPSCECHSPTETGWEEKIPFQKHDKQCGYATCDSRIMIDFIRETLATQKETLIAEMVGELRGQMELHTHNSIPSYTADADEGCITCIKNQGIETAIKNIKGVE